MKHSPIHTLENIKALERKPEDFDTRVTLLDALDTILEKGAVINGDVAIRVADVDLSI
jgi:hypothetical protein